MGKEEEARGGLGRTFTGKEEDARGFCVPKAWRWTNLSCIP